MKKYRLFLLFAPITLFILASVSPLLQFIQAIPESWDNPLLAPPSNSHTAFITTTVSITFNELINPASISPDTFAAHAMQTGQLWPTFDVNGGQITLTPQQAFHAGEWVYATATTGIQNMGGQSPPNPTVWGFRTRVAPGGGAYTNTQTSNAGNVWALELGDLNGDQSLDLFIGTEGGDKVWLNNGTGYFVGTGQVLGSHRTLDATLGDLDGDGDLDALVIKDDGGNQLPAQVWLNNGTGIFSAGDSLNPFATQFRVATLGDVDGDGDLDVFIGGVFGDEVWLNDGNGDFSNSGQLLGGSDTFGVDLGDLDNDGDLDAFTGNAWLQANLVWLNDGAGNFTSNGQALGMDFTSEVALGDLDYDGDLDAFVGNSFSTPADQVWINDGSGNFTNSGLALGTGNTFAVVLGDVEGDGDLDVITTEAGGRIWLNEGSLAFAQSSQTFATLVGNALALGDVRGNGRLDIALEAGPVQIWWNINPVTCRQDCINHVCTISCISICNISRLVGRMAGVLSGIDLQLFYDVRDQILAGSPQGQHYVDLFYTYDPEILSLLVADPSLWDEGVAVLTQWQPNLQALVNGQGSTATITAGQVQAVEDFLDNLSAAGSPALQQTISEELTALPPPETFVGMTMDEAWRALIGYSVFLPFLQR